MEYSRKSMRLEATPADASHHELNQEFCRWLWKRARGVAWRLLEVGKVLNISIWLIDPL